LNLDLVRELSVSTDSRIILLVLDGLGGLPMDPFGRTELEAANTPNLDSLAARSDLGLSRPVAAGVSPGSGPGHLALFGYDPLEYEVGRGVLSALGIGFELSENDLAARINFATKDEAGRISDRRAGRIANEEASKLVDLLNENVKLDDAEVFVTHEKEHRAVAVFRAEGLSDALSDSDPQRTGFKPLPVEPKAAIIEEADALIPELLDLGPAALAVTGDHATPAKMESHSWHGVPFLLFSEYTLPTSERFGERTCAGGSLGVFPAKEIMGLLMGHALKFNRYGA
jgi:2,3-bisphosphoglycerate-independent phosphoglycerate mutase